MDEKTLRYLDLETDYEPQYPNGPNVQQLLANQSSFNKANRFRSFSTSAKEKKAAEEYGYDFPELYGYSAAEALAFQQAQINEQIAQHNMAVQQFSSQTSTNRPRARTAGTLDNLSARSWRNVGTSHFADDPLTRSVQDYGGLSDTFRALSLQNQFAPDFPQDLEADTSSEATRALWLGGIPSSTTQSSLKVAFEPYGPIESARVLTQKGCGFVNFERKESAIHAKNHLQGKEIFPGAPVRIGYAKAPSATGTPANEGVYQSPSPDPFAQSHGKGAKSSTTTSGFTGQRSGGGEGATITIPELSEIKDDILRIVTELGATEEDYAKIVSSVDEALHHEYYEPEIPSTQEPSQNRMFDAPRLRDIRKRIDNNSCSAVEIEEIAMTMLPEIAELSSDYLGNTVVQKLFEFCSEHVKEAMLQEIAPHLAEIGVHKNGTWAAQKIIDVARTPSQMKLIVDHLRAYSMALFLDQYGNYVMQCCLRFQVPWNNHIFESMLSRLWPIAQGRFGARAMRACLESHYSTKDQQRMLAAAVALHSVHLATNANGALLLTWFLDTCNFPNRRKVLAPRLEPHLVHLCTHKVAYLTVLKIINQRNEPDARDSLLSALFFTPDDYVLEEILKDQSCGAMFIFKVLTTPFLEEDFRSSIVENVRKVLLKIKAQPSQGYKRLMDEVGLSTRGSHAPHKENSGGGRDVADASAGAAAPSGFERQFSGGMGNEQGQTQFNAGVSMPSQRSSSVDSNMSFDQFSGGGMRSSGPAGMIPAADMNSHAQLQYQQGAPTGRPTGAYSVNPQTMNGFSGAPPPGITNASRPGVSSQQPVAMAPGMIAQGGFNPQSSFGQVGGMNNGSVKMWQQYPNGYVMPQQQMQGQAMTGGGSRGRVSLAFSL